MSISQKYEGRDRTAARATLGREFPALALSIGEVGASFHHGPRFRRPPYDPATVGFPESRSDPGFPLKVLPEQEEAQVLARIHPAPGLFTFHGALRDGRFLRLTPLTCLGPPGAQSPFA